MRHAIALAFALVGCGITVTSQPGSGAADAPAVFDSAEVADNAPSSDLVDADLVVDTTSVLPVDAGADTSRDAAVDASRDTAVTPPRCDPSALADAGEAVDDASTPADAPYVVALSVGTILHQCARMSDGTVRCKGFNNNGQLGRGSSSRFGLEEPQVVPGLADVEQVVAHELDATCTRHRDGSVRCWGSNHYGQLGTGHDGDETCAAFGSSEACRTRPALVEGLTDVVQLAAGDFSVCAVRADGSVWCWGTVDLLLPSGGSPRPVRTTLADVVGLWPHSLGWLARLRSGRYVIVGGFRGAEAPPDALIDDVIDRGHLCYRLPDTSVRCLGLNADGKVGNGTSTFPMDVESPFDPGLCGVRSIVVGGYNTCALLADRRVSCWGDAFGSDVPNDTRETCVGITRPSRCQTRPTLIPGLDRVASIYPAIWGGCAIRLDRSVWCWGGQGDRANPMTPIEVRW